MIFVLLTVNENELLCLERKLKLCVNHMTAPNTSCKDLLSIAFAVGATGVVFRRGKICANLDIKNDKITGEDVVGFITGAKTQEEYS